MAMPDAIFSLVVLVFLFIWLAETSVVVKDMKDNHPLREKYDQLGQGLNDFSHKVNRLLEEPTKEKK